MDHEELEQIVDEIQTDEGEIKPVATGEGLIAYRKYLWALKFIEQKIEKLEDYKRQVVGDIDHKIETEKNNIARIRSAIEMALEVDPIADKSKTGGKTLSLPDIATVSISKVSDKVVIDDPDAILDTLGQEFGKVKVSLDVTKAKEHLLQQDKIPFGAHKEKSRTLSIRFTR